MKKNKIIVFGIPTLVILFLIYIAVSIYSNMLVRNELDKTINALSSYATIKYNSFSLNPFGAKIRIKDLSVNPVDSNEKIKIKEINIYDYDVSNNIPFMLNFEIKGLNFNLSETSLAKIYKKDIEKFGLNKINADINFIGNYNLSEKKLIIHQLKISQEKIGTIDVNIIFDNLNLSNIKLYKNVIFLMFILPSISIEKAKIIYTDASLVKKLIQDYSNNKKQPINKTVDDIILKLNEKKLKKDDIASIKNFLLKPDSIVISAKPNNPVNIGEIISAKSLKELTYLLNINFFTKINND